MLPMKEVLRGCERVGFRVPGLGGEPVMVRERGREAGERGGGEALRGGECEVPGRA